MFSGGEILSISYKNTTDGEGTWYPVAGEDLTIDIGGVRTNDNEQGITGDGQPIYSLERKRWSAEGTVAWDSTDKGNTNAVVAMKLLASSKVETDFTISLINGAVWTGTGKVVGDIKGSVKDSKITLKIAGGGELKPA